ncbi:nucleotidyltransferase, partial [Achromatium sp. WMS3]
DSLFVPRHCITYSTPLAEHVREHRNLFLHKGAWHKFKGYAYAQIRKMSTKGANAESRRYESFQKYGYDVKFAYHVVRLLNEVEQILLEKTLDLQRNREQLKTIRAGEWTQKQIVEYFERKELSLEEIYNKSDLPHKPDVETIKRLFMECLEMHYGSLREVVQTKTDINMLINDINHVLLKYQSKNIDLQE